MDTNQLVADLRTEQTFLGSSREASDDGSRTGRWDRLQRAIDFIVAVPVEAAKVPKVVVPKDMIEARAQGRSEALAMLLDCDPDTFCGEYIVDCGSLPSGDQSECWDEEKLRELFRADDSAFSLMQSAEAEYWHNVGMRDGMRNADSPMPGVAQEFAGNAQEFAHPDDSAVDAFAGAMKEKLALERAKGRGGWQQCDPSMLSAMLREHVEKGDPRDVANLSMMLWALKASITSEGRNDG